MLFVTFGFLKYLRIQPISQFRAQNTNTSPCYHIIEVMPVIVYSQVSRNCCYRIPCITNPWRHIPIFPVKKFSSHKCRSSMTGWKRISSITIRSFLLSSNHREVNRQYYPTEQLRQSNAIKKNDSTHKA